MYKHFLSRVLYTVKTSVSHSKVLLISGESGDTCDDVVLGHICLCELLCDGKETVNYRNND